jgi:hypothetical protein
MLIRFFNDWDLAGKERLLTGISFPTADRGEAREAVHVATPEEVERYADAYQAYREALSENHPALVPHVGPEMRPAHQRDPVTGRWRAEHPGARAQHAGERAEHAGEQAEHAAEGDEHAGD